MQRAFATGASATCWCLGTRRAARLRLAGEVSSFELTEPPPDGIKYAPVDPLALMLHFGKNNVRVDISSLETIGPDIVAAIRRLTANVAVGACRLDVVLATAIA